MQVVKRNGRLEDVSFDKIYIRIKNIANDLKLDLNRIDIVTLAKEVIQCLYDGITTENLDIFTANKCADKIYLDPQYDKLAAGILVSNLHKSTDSDFSAVTQKLYDNVDVKGNVNSLVTDEYLKFVRENNDYINSIIDYERDYLFDFFGFKTLEQNSYLYRIKNVVKRKNLAWNNDNNNDNDNDKNNSDKNSDDSNNDNKTSSTNRRREKERERNKEKEQEKENEMVKKFGRIVERPQHMLMRVAIFISNYNLEWITKNYKALSEQKFTHASPTLFNSGSKRPQLSSCFLLHMEDSIKGIFNETISEAANISKYSGGIGIHISHIRAKDSYIRSTNGNSDGIIPMIKVLNEVARYVNQGGRRKGAFSTYLEVWHGDIYEYCEMRKSSGAEELRARDIFLGLWVPDLFMKRVQEKKLWSLMCPDECKGLTTTWGDDFEKLYEKYEAEGKYIKQVYAHDLYRHILTCQLESGMPYMLFKDTANRLSNQKNIGTLTGSNLCTEILEVVSEDETAVCNLASLCLSKFVKADENGKLYFDFDDLCATTGLVTRNLNTVIDVTFYPSERAKRSNIRHRPIAIGVQGYADALCMLKLPYGSAEATKLGRKIFEHIYFAALTESNEIAKVSGPYSTFAGSPFSQGLLQFHMFGLDQSLLSPELDWNALVESIKEFGLANSLLTSIMPTASTSQIMGNSEAAEPYSYNLYKRKTQAGEFLVINKHLVEDLIKLGLWTDEIRNTIMYDNGSVQYIPQIPVEIRELYKTSYELGTKIILQQSMVRAPFIDQSQSQNLFFKKPDHKILSQSHFYSWRGQLKTGMYYLRSQPSFNPIKFGLDQSVVAYIETTRKIYNRVHNTNYPINSIYNNDDDDHKGVGVTGPACSSCAG